MTQHPKRLFLAGLLAASLGSVAIAQNAPQATAAQPALASYARTCTAVFEQLAAAGGRLAEGGADIARAADGHAADARLMREAWPVRE